MISNNEESEDVDSLEYVSDKIIESISDEMIELILDEMIESMSDSVLTLFISNSTSEVFFDISINATIFRDESLVDFATFDELSIMKFS